MTTLDRSADNYGLSLILGGAEASLWDLAGIYASMARTINNYASFNAKYAPNGFRPPTFELNKDAGVAIESKNLVEESPLGAGACYLTFQAMLEVSRPDGEKNWRDFSSSSRIAWKTGTSYGYRDAWAIGVTPQYVVATWAGNADGEGRPGLVGLQAAAPIMFDVFDMLRSDNRWFDMPHDDLIEVDVCKQSGHRASPNCPQTHKNFIPIAGQNTPACPYHEMVNLDPTGQFRVHSDCESPYNMLQKAWFLLPPAQAEWYRKKHVDYRDLPPYREDCRAVAQASNAGGNIEFIYPRTSSKVYVPKGLDGKLSSVVFEVAHRKKDAKIHWHLDKSYLGTTEVFHQLAMNPGAGEHVLTLVDGDGEELRKRFEVVGE